MKGHPSELVQTFEGWIRGIMCIILNVLPNSTDLIAYLWNTRPSPPAGMDPSKEVCLLLTVAHVEHSQCTFAEDGTVRSWHEVPVPALPTFLAPHTISVPSEIDLRILAPLKERLRTLFSRMNGNLAVDGRSVARILAELDETSAPAAEVSQADRDAPNVVEDLPTSPQTISPRRRIAWVDPPVPPTSSDHSAHPPSPGGDNQDDFTIAADTDMVDTSWQPDEVHDDLSMDNDTLNEPKVPSTRRRQPSSSPTPSVGPSKKRAKQARATAPVTDTAQMEVDDDAGSFIPYEPPAPLASSYSPRTAFWGTREDALAGEWHKVVLHGITHVLTALPTSDFAEESLWLIESPHGLAFLRNGLRHFAVSPQFVFACTRF